MKTKNQTSIRSCRFVSLALLAGTVTTGLSANGSPQGSTGSEVSQSSAQSQSGSQQAGETVRVTRASNFLGTDVTASDNRKVGDIVDYVFDTSATPHLQYVVVMTGGFLGYGGDARAVPAGAISMEGDAARLNMSSEDYWNVAVLPQDRIRYLKNEENRNRLTQAFNVSGNQNRQTAQAQSGSNSQGTLVTFTELTNVDVFDREGQRIGEFEDTWLSLDLNRAPYAEISSPPQSPFEVVPRQRYAIPLRQLQASSDGYRFNITEEQLRNSDPISETEGVRLLQSGEIGQQILRVRVAQR